MLRYIIFAPLAGAAINWLVGRRLRSERFIGAVACGSVLVSALVAFYLAFASPGVLTADANRPVLDHLWTWIRVGDFRADFGFAMDRLSGIYVCFITFVGFLIHLFATGYMHGDRSFYRFFAYLNLFMFMMLTLVLADNMLLMFVGWEGVGLCSYLLIGYYIDRKEAGDAAKKAFVANRVGDWGVVMGILLVFLLTLRAGAPSISFFDKDAAVAGGTAVVSALRTIAGMPVESFAWGALFAGGITSAALLLFVGATGKSAQIPLFVWLPDAMAGPTPVSALIHAATMVTAGVYMIVRCTAIYSHAPTAMFVVAIIGALTAIFAATTGIAQNDIKKVLAYSTVSQLGYMMLACGVGAFVAAIFHVMTHAFFKALLFLGSGSVIHGMHHEQDMRRMGGLRKYMPYTYWTFFAGWLAICGIIPFSGFWSKDEILWQTVSTEYIPGGWILWLVATIAATCTAFYMTRLVAMTFWGKERFLEVTAGGEADEAHAHGYDEEGKPHDARMESAGDRPHHEPGEHVGIAHDEHVAHDVGGAHAVDEHGHGAHGHGSHTPHESPPSMWVPLAVLATLAIVGGLVGISPAFTGGKHVGGRLNVVNWLEPVIWNPQTRGFGKEHEGSGAGEHARGAESAGPLLASSSPAAATEESHGDAGSKEAANPYHVTGFNLAHAAEKSLGHTGAEWLFIVISLVVAGFGIFLGWLFYAKNPRLPDAWAARLAPLYRASFNKYWVDELYGMLFTRRTMDAARGVYAVDSRGIDGAVNGSAWLTRLSSRITGAFDRIVVDGIVNGIAGFIGRIMSGLLRSAQTGFAQNYALVMVLGLVVAVALFFGPDLVAAVKGIFAFVK